MTIKFIFAAAGLLAAPASAQSLSILVTEGDNVPGVGLITSVAGVSVASDGTTYIEVDTDNPDTDIDGAMLLNGMLVLREGQALLAPTGATLDSFDGTSAGPGGLAAFNLFLDGTSGTNDDSGVYYGTNLVLQEGTISTSPAFSPGTPYIGFFDVELGAPNEILVVASIDDPAIASTVDRALVVLLVDAAGNLLNERVIAKEGDVLPGQTEAIADFETGAEESAINAAGQVLYGVDLAGITSADGAIYLDQTLLMQEGSPSPVAGRTWGSLSSPEVDLNDAGDWVVKTTLDNSNTSDDDVIVKNGAIFRRAGDTLPDIAPFTLTDFGGSVGVWLTDSGDVIWYGDWDDPDTSRDEGIFINDRLVIQEGVTVVNGQTIIDLSDITEQIAVSPDGSRMLVEGEINTGGSDLDVVIQVLFTIGTNYCPAVANSTGQPGEISAVGSVNVVDNDVTLMASNLPANSFGYFLNSRMQGFIANPGNSQGNLCLGGAIGRYVGPNEVQNSGATGTFELQLDLTQTPTPTGFVAIVPGETWHFQAWYRDLVGGVATSNFTDAISITFQ